MNEVGGARTPQICRLCLAQTTVCFSLIEDTEDSRMLEALTSLRILPTDEISTIMCLKCRLNLKLAFSIQQNMLRAERRFREQHSSLQIKEEIEDSIEFEHIKIEEPLDSPEDGNNILRQLLKKDSASTHLCEVCGVEKTSRRNLQLHNYNVHQSRKCPECEKDIKSGRFREHLEQHRGAPMEDEEAESFSCHICGIVKTSRKLLHHHNYNVHLTKKCPECNKEVKLGKFKYHLEQQHGIVKLEEEPRSFTCQICGIVKASRKLLHDHNYNVHLTKRCPLCGEDVKWNKFTAHMDAHSGTNPSYVCDICGVCKSSKKNLSHHRYNVHMSRKCPHCNKEVKLTKFKHHVDRHRHMKKPTKGAIKKETENGTQIECGEGVKLRKLRAHVDAHTYYTCDICGVNKSSKKNLSHHKYNVHRSKKCPHCNQDVKLTKFKYHVDRHRHTKKPTKAAIRKGTEKNEQVECGEGVKLRKLGQQVEGTVSYTCDVCGVSKSSKKNLTHHRYNVHMSRKCPECDKDVKLTKFKQHVDRHKRTEKLTQILIKEEYEQSE